MATQTFQPVHPGEIILEEYLIPMGISQYRLAKDISVPARRINEIVHGKRAISADTALRLARFFGTTELFWVNLQSRYDMEVEKDRLAGRLEREVSVYKGSGAGIPSDDRLLQSSFQSRARVVSFRPCGNEESNAGACSSGASSSRSGTTTAWAWRRRSPIS